MADLDQVFLGMSLQTLTPKRIASLIERSSMTHESIVRALDWTPRDSDVIIASPPQCGQLLVSKMVRMLLARDDDEMEMASSSSTLLLESRETDLDALIHDQATGMRRVFRTYLSQEALQNKMTSSHAKTVIIIRHPRDLREMWFTYLRSCTIAGMSQALRCSQYEVAFDFDERFNPEDFANVPVTLIQPLSTEPLEEYTYEDNMHRCIEWANNNSNVMLLFLEELLASPEVVLDKLAGFLEVTLEPAKADEILLSTTAMNLLSADLLASELLTSTQSRFLKFRFMMSDDPDEEEEEDSPRPDLLEKMNSSYILTERGIFAAEYPNDKKQMETTRDKGSKPYEELYTFCTGKAYPIANPEVVKRKNFSFRKAANSGNSVELDTDTNEQQGRMRNGSLSSSPIGLARKLLGRVRLGSTSSNESGSSFKSSPRFLRKELEG